MEAATGSAPRQEARAGQMLRAIGDLLNGVGWKS
jgi:hypothetical protein